MKGFEGIASSRLLAEKTKELEAQGLKKSLAVAQAKVEVKGPTGGTRWSIFPGKQFKTGTRFDIREEYRLVKEWRKAGENPELAPQTPYVDRLQSISKLVGMPFQQGVHTLDVYTQRNEMFHHPPPNLSTFVVGATVNWEDVWLACKKSKDKVYIDFRKGLLSETHRDFFCSTIDA